MYKEYKWDEALYNALVYAALRAAVLGGPCYVAAGPAGFRFLDVRPAMPSALSVDSTGAITAYQGRSKKPAGNVHALIEARRG